MFYLERRKLIRNVFAGLAVLLIFSLSACASNRASIEEPSDGNLPASEPESKLVTDISVEGTEEGVTVWIKGNQLLTYTPVKQPLPLGLVLYFPETSLGIAKKEYQVEGDIIESIKAEELIENGPSKITITMRTDAPYQISRDGNGLSILFGSADQEKLEAEGDQPVEEEAAVEEGKEIAPELAEAAEITEAETLEASPDVTPDQALAETALVPAVESSADSGVNMLREIQTSGENNGLRVLIHADRMIRDYKAFTLSDPPRIVFDLYGIKSEFKKQQTIPVDSKWVKRVRHFAGPERLRVVLDTEKEYLTTFRSEPSEKGLLVLIGDAIEPKPVDEKQAAAMEIALAAPAAVVVADPSTSAGLEASTSIEETGVESDSPVVSEPAPEESESSAVAESLPEPAVMEPESVPEKAALVNRIDFLSGDEGKSSIIIGTTRPVEYSLEKWDGDKLSLNLFETKILSYRQRPLITTRFESAVDRIIPVQTPGMKNNSKIIIELREAVPYTIEQAGNEIQIDFEVSSIPPKLLEAAGLVPWEKVMAEAASDAEIEIARAEMSKSATEQVSGKALETVEKQPMGIAFMEADEMRQLSEVEVEEAEADPATLAELALEEEEELAVEEKVKRKFARKYTGEKIALDFYQTDIKNVLRILRDVSGKNFAIDKDVKGSVTLTLVKPIPWDQVLDLILKMNQLGQVAEGDIVRIVTISTLRKEEKIWADELKAAQALKEQQVALEPLITEYIPINYANAGSDIQPRLEQIKTPKRGQVGVDARNNQIIMTDTAEKVAQAREIIKSIDKVTPQVIIEASIVEVSESFSRNIGVEWGLTSGPITNSNATHTYDVAMNHPATGASSSIGYQFARIAGSTFSLNAELQAIETSGDGKIISSPKIVTLDNKQATIKQGLEYPYLERDSSGLATVKFKKIDLELNVKPHVTPDNRIAMEIDITKNDIESITGGVPSLSTNEAKTELLVNDTDTIVIGGILKSSEQEGENRFPLLSQIPVIGWLFKSKNVSNQKKELLIFITPKIVHLETHT
ncbi:MAG: type IV pilus secretin PilQ [Desulfobacterales bacterium]